VTATLVLAGSHKGCNVLGRVGDALGRLSQQQMSRMFLLRGFAVDFFGQTIGLDERQQERCQENKEGAAAAVVEDLHGAML